MISILLVIVGIAGGLVVGGGVVAFFTVLGVVTRIIELGRTQKFLSYHKTSILMGAVCSTLIYIFNLSFSFDKYLLIFIGFSMGIFVGMVASALAEVLDVIPITSNYLGIIKWIYILIIGMVLGKVFGSLIYWIIPGFF